MGSKNQLAKLELEAARDFEKKRRNRRHKHKDRERRRQVGENTRIGEAVGERRRKPPPVPQGKTLKEIREMPPESVEFRHPDGRPRRWKTPTGETKTEPQSWKDHVRIAEQDYRNQRRAKARKWEAEVVVASKVLGKRSNDPRNPKNLYDEDRLIAESILDLEDWDNEELIRGYRRNRNGRFGSPPQYIPREIQQEAFRRLIGRGERKMKVAYMEAVEQLVRLAQSADSEKVRLDAIKALMERVVGKVPDIVRVSQEQPWEAMLADAIVPLSEAIPLELTPNAEGTYALEGEPEFTDSEGEVETSTAEAAQRDPTTTKAPSPSRRSKKSDT